MEIRNNKNLKGKYYILISICIIIITLFIIMLIYPYFKVPNYKVNKCLEAYECVKKENNLYSCKYCSEFDNDTCIKEKSIECELNNE